MTRHPLLEFTDTTAAVVSNRPRREATPSASGFRDRPGDQSELLTGFADVKSVDGALIH